MTFAITITITLLIGSTTAITGNSTIDQTPYVGVIVLFADAAKTQPIGYCTGFLISSTVMITAGHSLINTAAVSVCFDQSPISYTIENGQIIYHCTETIYDGAVARYPGYISTLSGNEEYSTSDIGLIIFNTPITEVIEYAALPAPGMVDTLPVKTTLNVIGYGSQTQIQPRNNGLQNSWSGIISRMNADVVALPSNFKGSDTYLKLTANSAQGKGGVAFGDSGGPVIYTNSEGKDIAIAVNAYVSNINCGGISYHTRIDDLRILEWINRFY